MSLANAAPCPFCGSSNLDIEPWTDESGEYDAIECKDCLGAAPADIWNTRATPASDYQPPHWEMAE